MAGMKAVALVLVLLHVGWYAPGSATAAAVPGAGATVGWQAHSYDDMREWTQLFRKGARYLKLDPYYEPQSFCSTQTGVNNPSDPRGCFVFNHNTPVTSRADYNTTDQLLHALSSQQFRAYWTQPSTFYISLCFKSAPDFCDASSAAWNNWLALVDEIFANATAAIAANGLNLEFILDGDGVAKDCLAQRWRPWNSTYITGDDPQGAFTSNNVSLGYDRFTVLNEPTSWFPVAAVLGFGKFADNASPVTGDYTWLLWEPSSQSEIGTMISTYTNNPKHVVHDQGLRFAINIDPAMFQVYSSPSTGGHNSWNDVVASHGTDGSAVVIDSDGGDGQQVLITMFRNSDGVLQFTTSQFAAPLGRPTTAAARDVDLGVDFNGTVTASTTVVRARTGASATVILASDGARAILYIALTSAGSWRLDPVAELMTGAVLGASVSLVNTDGQSHMHNAPGLASSAAFFVVVGRGPDSACGTQLSLLTTQPQLGDSTTWSRPVPVGPPTCIDAALHPTTVHASFAMVAAGKATGVVVAGTADNHTLASVLCLDLASGAVTAGACEAPQATSNTGHARARPAAAAGAGTSFSQYHVGTNPAVSVRAADGVAYMVETHGRGFCPNSETHNKQAPIGACDQVPTSTPWVMNYAIGAVADFAEILVAGKFVSACSPTVMHGAFDQGTLPRPAMFWAPAVAAQARAAAALAAATTGTPLAATGASRVLPAGLGFVVTHDGLPAGTPDVGNCGAPNAVDGVVADAWEVDYVFDPQA